MVAASVVQGSDLLIKDVGVNPTRTGIIDVLAEMGADIELLKPCVRGGEPIADIRVKHKKLRGVRIAGDMSTQSSMKFPFLPLPRPMPKERP